MKITAVIGAIPGNDYNSPFILSIIDETMREIGESINIINLAEQNIPYEQGSFAQGSFSAIENEITSSDGVIFITTSNLFAPTAIMQNFLEHFCQPIYKNTLKEKNCMIVAISNNQEVGSTMDYLSKVITFLGGYDSVKIPLSYSITKNIAESDKLLIEKYTEDFYRYVKQGRKFFTPYEVSVKNAHQLVTPAGGAFQKNTNSKSYTPEIIDSKNYNDNLGNKDYGQRDFSSPSMNPTNNAVPTNTASNKNSIFNVYNNNKNIGYNDQDNDLLEITKSLSNRLSRKSDGDSYEPITKDNFGKKPLFNSELTSINPNDISPKTLTAKQMTQNLTHYFQPHLSDGLTCSVALNITGDEGFDGVIYIDKQSCDYSDGKNNSADVLITATDDIWKQITKGEVSTQRAFMTGQIKVRGNFVLLSKFDTLFKR